MQHYKISGKEIDFDETKRYLDFYLQGEKQILAEMNFEPMLYKLQSGELPVDENLEQFLTYLQRWKSDAPRKRFYRKMRADGFTVCSNEQFFDGEDGENIINDLENTGVFADYFLNKIYSNKNESEAQ